jgi:5'-nucleotidase
METCEERLVVNLNVPDLPAAQIRGVRVTRTASTEEETLVTADENSCREVDECEGAGIVLDSRAVAAGYVSVTPLRVDLTARDMLDLVRGWELDVSG